MGDGVIFAVQKSDVQDSAGHWLGGDGTRGVRDDQSGVGFVDQVGRDINGSNRLTINKIAW